LQFLFVPVGFLRRRFARFSRSCDADADADGKLIAIIISIFVVDTMILLYEIFVFPILAQMNDLCAHFLHHQFLQ
jgi:hypothetical protein